MLQIFKFQVIPVVDDFAFDDNGHSPKKDYVLEEFPGKKPVYFVGRILTEKD
jgi:hypothetical protein